MTQRHNKIHGYTKGRRSVFSSEDPEKILVELEKARKQYASKKPESSREFSSYFYGRNKSKDPFYIATSHEISNPESVHKSVNHMIKKQVIPAYPSLVPGLRWSPSVNSFDDEMQEKQEFVCRRCRNCKETYVPERNWVFKDNIIRFCDNSTMTPNLNDAACGVQSPHIEAAHSSTISISTSNIAVRDEPEPQVRLTPTSILKKNDDISFKFQYYEQNPVDLLEFKDHTYIESSPTSRITKQPTYPCPSEVISGCDNPRKNIYNEGISDMIANNFPSYCPLTNRIIQVPVNAKRNYSRTSFFSKNVEIPFAHRNLSKYHHECKTDIIKKPYRCRIEGEVRSIAKPGTLRCCQPGGPERCDFMSCVKMPKKVLSSERDIEMFIHTQERRPQFF